LHEKKFAIKRLLDFLFDRDLSPLWLNLAMARNADAVTDHLILSQHFGVKTL